MLSSATDIVSLRIRLHASGHSFQQTAGGGDEPSREHGEYKPDPTREQAEG